MAGRCWSPTRSGSRGWRRWRARPTRSTRGCWPSCRFGIWCRRSGCRRRSCARAGALPLAAALVKHRATLKNRVHSSLIAFGHQVPDVDLFGVAGRKLLEGARDPRAVALARRASLVLIDDLERRIARSRAGARALGADHRYIPILMTAPGFGWITRSRSRARSATSAASPRPVKLTGYTGLCPRVSQSGEMDRAARCPSTGPGICAGG